MKKVCILTWHDISAAYSCLLYLKEELGKDMDISLWGRCERDKIDKDMSKNYHSFFETWYGKFKGIRVVIARLHAFFIALGYNNIIINDLDFYRIMYFVKFLFPRKKIIHYNTEIYDGDVTCSKSIQSFYRKHSNYPDMIIECSAERAEYRKHKYGIRKKIYVINNTVPQKYINGILAQNKCIENFFDFENNGLPILIYAGGCNMSRGLKEMIDSAYSFEDRLN